MGTKGWFDLAIAFAPVIAILVAAFFGKKKLEEIHLLVNSRLSVALNQISVERKSHRELILLLLPASKRKAMIAQWAEQDKALGPDAEGQTAVTVLNRPVAPSA